MQYRGTALHEAAKGGHTRAVKALVTAGADVNAANGVSYILDYLIEVCEYSFSATDVVGWYYIVVFCG